MQRWLVMTVIGADRPGIVESVASLVAQHGGNWLGSRMSRLGGQFAGIVQAQVPTEREAALLAELAGLKARGLTVVVQSESVPSAPAASGTTSRLEIVGQDRPGIVQQISRALATFGANVEELQTDCASAAMSGETVFTARARVSLPPGCDADALRDTLQTLATDLIVDISFEPFSGDGRG